MDRERADLWCERGILGLILAILVIGPVATGAVHTFDFLFLQFLTVLTMLLWSARLWLAPRPKLLWPTMSWAVVAFVILAIGRYLACDIELVGRLELIRIILYAFLFFVIVNNLHKQEYMQIIALVLVLLAMAIAFYALYQFFSGSNRVWNFISPYKNRASGTYISPNHLGGFLEMVLPLALAFSLAGRLKPSIRILVGYAGLVILAAIGVTVSRGTWLATTIGLLLFLLLLLSQKTYRLPALVVLAALTIGGVFLLPKAMFVRVRIARMFSDNELNANTRFDIWEPAVRMWQENPVWGVGPGHFDSLFRAYRPQGVQLQPDWVHNDYLNTLTDWGLAGTAVVLAAWVLLGLGAVKTWRAVRPQNSDLGPITGSGRFALTLGIITALTAILVHSWVDFNMHIPANAILCVTLMALLASQIRFTTRQQWIPVNLAGKAALTGVLLLASGWLVYQGVRRAGEEAWLQRADRLDLFSTEQTDALRKAFRAEPRNAETAYRIGEAYRVHSLQGGDDYISQAEAAMGWYKTSMTLDPWNGYGFLRYGMCLDWIGRSTESHPYFVHATSLDPAGYFTVAHVGLHYVQKRDYAAARQWFERSIRLNRLDNPIAFTYLDICHARLLESATNSGVSLGLPP